MSATTDKATDGNGWVGRAMRRKEDPRMITGEGTYVDDMTPHGTLLRGDRALARGPCAHCQHRHLGGEGARRRRSRCSPGRT